MHLLDQASRPPGGSDTSRRTQRFVSACETHQKDCPEHTDAQSDSDRVIHKMAPSSSQKGTGKKAGGAGAIRQQSQQQQQRSRNTTPGPAPTVANLPPIETVEAETIELRFDVFRNLTFEDMVDPAASNILTPDSKSLDGLLSRLQKLGDIIEKRGTCCDRGMRLLAQTRRQRMDDLAVERGREEERRQREAEDEERERKANKKKRKGADTLAPQGGNIGQSSPTLSVCSFQPVLLFILHSMPLWTMNSLASSHLWLPT